jgi:predicted PurR-regulated permease PerM
MMPDTKNAAPTEAAYEPQWEPWFRRLGLVVLLIVVWFAADLLRPVAGLLAMTFIIGLLTYMIGDTLADHTFFSFRGAVIAAYIFLVGLTIIGTLLLIPPLVNSIESLYRTFEDAYHDLVLWMEEYEPDQGVIDVVGIEFDLNPYIDPVRRALLGEGEVTAPDDAAESGDAPAGNGFLDNIDITQITQGIFNIAGRAAGAVTSVAGWLFGVIFAFIMALFLSFLILMGMDRTKSSIERWIPSAYLDEYHCLMYEIADVWRGFFKGQVIIGIVIGFLTWLQLALMGVSSAAVLAVFAGVISLIPTIGGIIALIPIGIVPLIGGSSVFVGTPNWLIALIVIFINLLISQIIWNVVAPKILGDALELSLPVILIGVFIGSAVGGVAGAFLVAPIMSTIREIVFYVLSKISGQDPFPDRARYEM